MADALSRDARFQQVVHLVDDDDMIGALTVAGILSRNPQFRRPPGEGRRRAALAAVDPDGVDYAIPNPVRPAQSSGEPTPTERNTAIEIGCGGGGTSPLELEDSPVGCVTAS